MTRNIIHLKEISQVNTDINDRWEKGIDHHPKSVELFGELFIETHNLIKGTNNE